MGNHRDGQIERIALARRLQAVDDAEPADLDAATAALGRVVEDLRSRGS